MTLGRSTVKNLGFLTGGRVVSDVFQFVFFVALSRAYGAGPLGEYGFAMAVTGFFWCISNFGLFELSIREIKRKGKGFGSYAGSVILLRLVLAFIAFAMAVVVAIFLPMDRRIAVLIVLLGAFQIMEGLVAGIAAVAIAQGESHVLSGVEISQRFFTAVVGTIIILIGVPIELAVGVLPVVAGIHVFVCYRVVRSKYGPLPLRLNIEFARRKLKAATPFALVTVVRRVVTRADIILLVPLLGTVVAGIYNAAFRVMFMMHLLINRIPAAVMPAAVQLRAGDPDEFSKFFSRSIRLAILAGMPAAAGIMLIAEDLMMLVFGNEFAASAIVLQILGLTALTHMIQELLSGYCQACDEELFWSRAWFLAGTLNVILNLVLIPLFGAAGAACAVVLTEVALSAAMYWKLHAHVQVRGVSWAIGAAIVGSLAFVVPVFLIDDISMWFVIAISAPVYLLVVALIPDIRRNEGAFVAETVSKRLSSKL
jgi:O-antigen/teichoic acid export membrane protein